MKKPLHEAQKECWDYIRKLKLQNCSKEKAIRQMEHIEMSYQLYPEATEKALRGVEWWPGFKEGHSLRWNWHAEQYDGKADGHHDGRDDRPHILHVEYDDYEQTFFIAKPYYDEFKQLVEDARKDGCRPDYAGFVNKKKRDEQWQPCPSRNSTNTSNQTAAPAPDTSMPPPALIRCNSRQYIVPDAESFEVVVGATKDWTSSGHDIFTRHS
jgi:hypothetical protein